MKHIPIKFDWQERLIIAFAAACVAAQMLWG